MVRTYETINKKMSHIRVQVQLHYMCVCVYKHSSINPETALSATDTIQPEYPSSSVTMPNQQGTVCKITVPEVAPPRSFLIMYYWCNACNSRLQ